MKLIRYTAEERSFLLSFIPGHSYAEIAEAFSKRFRPLTMNNVKAFCGNNHVTTGRNGQFKKGMVPHNKGKPFPSKGRAPETQFKPGHMPHNYRPVGSERINRDGYVEVKVADPKTWKTKHRIVWEAHHGEIPKGSIIVFRDGNKLNTDISNLALVSRGVSLKMNQAGVSKCGSESFDTAVLLSRVVLARGRRRNRKHETGT